MKKSLSLLFATVVIAALLLSACATAPVAPAAKPAADAAASTEAAPAGATLRVGYAVPDASNPFLSNLTKSVGEYFAPDGVEVIVADAQQLLSLGDYYQMVVKGVVLLAAVGFDTWQKNHKASKSRKPATQGAVAA